MKSAFCITLKRFLFFVFILIQTEQTFSAVLIRFNKDGNKILAKVNKTQTVKKGDMFQTDTGCLLEAIAQKGEKLFLKNDLCSSEEITLNQKVKKLSFKSGRAYLASRDAELVFHQDEAELAYRGPSFAGNELTDEEKSILEKSEPMRLYRTTGLIMGWYAGLSFPDYKTINIMGEIRRERELTEQSAVAISFGYKYLPVQSLGFYAEGYYSYLTSTTDVLRFELGSSWAFSKEWSTTFGLNMSRIENNQLAFESYGVGLSAGVQYALTRNIYFSGRYSAMNQVLFNPDQSSDGIGLMGVEFGIGMNF